MSTKAAQYSEMTKKASDECDMSSNVDLCGLLPNIPTICISDASEHDDVTSQNERSESFTNLHSNNTVEDKSPQVEIAESIRSLNFEDRSFYLKLPNYGNNLDLSAITTDESGTTPLGSYLSPDINYVPLEEEEDDDSSFYFEKSISGDKAVIESHESHSVVKGQNDTLEGEKTISDGFTDKTNTEEFSQSEDHDQAEASSHQKSDGGNLSQNNSVQETVSETKVVNRIPNGDIPNRTFYRSSLRKSVVPRSFLVDSNFEIYDSKHNFVTSNLTSETSENTKEEKDNVVASPQEKSRKKKKAVFSCLGFFSKQNGEDCDGNYYRKIGEDSDND